MSYLQLLPAVDITEGRAVQLAQGVAGSERVYGDPVAAARRWQDAGAEWLHLVDLDAAFGRGSNRELQAEIVGALDIQVEMSGGIRDDESLAAALATGCRRVNIGTAALEQPEWCARVIAEHGDRIAIGLDVRGRTLAARGWTREGGDLYEVLARLDAEGCARYVVTDVNKDGMLQGPNLDLLRSVCEATDRPVVASGGITELADLEALQQLDVRALEHAVLVHVGDDVAGAALGVEPGEHVVEVATLARPAAGRQRPAAYVEPDGDPVAVLADDAGAPLRLLEGRGADVDPPAAGGQGGGQRIVVPDAAAHLDGHVEPSDDLGQQLAVVAAAECGVQVDQVDPLRSRLLPAQGCLDRVAEPLLGPCDALDELDRLALGDVDGRQQLEVVGHARKPRRG